RVGTARSMGGSSRAGRRIPSLVVRSDGRKVIPISVGLDKCEGIPHFDNPTDRRYDYRNQGSVAQRLEQGTHNPLVLGSNPSASSARIGCRVLGVAATPHFAYFRVP